MFENFPPQIASKTSADLARVARARYLLEDALKELDNAVAEAKETTSWQAIRAVLGASAPKLCQANSAPGGDS